jgi:hypothetical protein
VIKLIGNKITEMGYYNPSLFLFSVNQTNSGFRVSRYLDHLRLWMSDHRRPLHVSRVTFSSQLISTPAVFYMTIFNGRPQLK